MKDDILIFWEHSIAGLYATNTKLKGKAEVMRFLRREVTAWRNERNAEEARRPSPFSAVYWSGPKR
jgi:hypothetical protein